MLEKMTAGEARVMYRRQSDREHQVIQKMPLNKKIRFWPPLCGHIAEKAHFFCLFHFMANEENRTEKKLK